MVRSDWLADAFLKISLDRSDVGWKGERGVKDDLRLWPIMMEPGRMGLLSTG